MWKRWDMKRSEFQKIRWKTCILAVVAIVIGLVLVTFPQPQDGRRALGSTMTSGATLYSVLCRLNEDQFSNDWPRMVLLSKAALVPYGKIPREYVSNHQTGSNLIVTNRTGTGGWYFDVSEKSLRLNLTNAISIGFLRKVILPPDFFVIDQSGVRFSFGAESNADVAAYLNDVRVKADLILQFAAPSTVSNRPPVDSANPN